VGSNNINNVNAAFAMPQQSNAGERGAQQFGARSRYQRRSLDSFSTSQKPPKRNVFQRFWGWMKGNQAISFTMGSLSLLAVGLILKHKYWKPKPPSSGGKTPTSSAGKDGASTNEPKTAPPKTGDDSETPVSSPSPAIIQGVHAKTQAKTPVSSATQIKPAEIQGDASASSAIEALGENPVPAKLEDCSTKAGNAKVQLPTHASKAMDASCIPSEWEELKNQPQEGLVQSLQRATATEAIGSGGEGSVYALENNSNLVFKVNRNADNISGMICLPIQYPDKLLAQNSNLGLPVAAFMKPNHSSVKAGFLTLEEASKAQYTILRRMHGTSLSEAKALDSFWLIQGKDPVTCQELHIKDLSENKKIQLIQELPNNYKIATILSELKYAALKKPSEDMLDMIEALKSGNFFPRFHNGLSPQLSPLPKNTVRTTSQHLIKAQNNFLQYYEKFRNDCISHIEQIATLPQATFDDALFSLKQLQDADMKLDFGQGCNTFYNAETQRFEFIDLEMPGYGGDKNNSSGTNPELFFNMLLGKWIYGAAGREVVFNKRDTRFIVYPKDREILNTYQETILQKMEKGAEVAGFNWNGNKIREAENIMLPPLKPALN
jgi:hypothetical protein